RLGIDGLDLRSGTRVESAQVVKGSITDETREAAHGWLRAHDYGDLIKNVVTVTFGKGEDDFAHALLENIKSMHDDGLLRFGALENREAVHSSTLAGFLRQRVASGEPF